MLLAYLSSQLTVGGDFPDGTHLPRPVSEKNAADRRLESCICYRDRQKRLTLLTRASFSLYVRTSFPLSGIVRLERCTPSNMKRHAVKHRILRNSSVLCDYIVSRMECTLCLKTTLMLHTIISTHINRFWSYSGRNVAERVCYRICYLLSRLS